MADITAERKMIQQEETKPQAAVTESVMSRVGGGINFINTRHYYIKEACLNGKYNIIVPNTSIDGCFTYPWAFEIVDVIVKLGSANGSGGTSEVDIKWKPETFGSFASIFSTTPKWTSSAVADGTVRIGVTRTGFTAPVLSKTTFDAYDILRVDLLQAVTGSPESFSVTIYTRPI
jgi:hypothetical protein